MAVFELLEPLCRRLFFWERSKRTENFALEQGRFLTDFSLRSGLVEFCSGAELFFESFQSPLRFGGILAWSRAVF